MFVILEKLLSLLFDGFVPPAPTHIDQRFDRIVVSEHTNSVCVPTDRHQSIATVIYRGIALVPSTVKTVTASVRDLLLREVPILSRYENNAICLQEASSSVSMADAHTQRAVISSNAIGTTGQSSSFTVFVVRKDD